MPTRAAKSVNNRVHSSEKFEQLIYCNFGPNDKYITLTYRDECLAEDRKQVMADFKWFRRKLLLRRQARGQPCYYVYVIEHKHGDGRWHAHAIINGCGDVDLEDIRACWTKGNADVRYFSYAMADELASYMVKERPDRVGQHLWMTSRGLRRPLVDHQIVPDAFGTQIPVGVIIKHKEERSNQWGVFQHLKYFRQN